MEIHNTLYRSCSRVPCICVDFFYFEDCISDNKQLTDEFLVRFPKMRVFYHLMGQQANYCGKRHVIL